MMADKKDQLDMNEADTDLDGEVTMKERMIGERVQPLKMVEGGLATYEEYLDMNLIFRKSSVSAEGKTRISWDSEKKDWVKDPNGPVVADEKGFNEGGVGHFAWVGYPEKKPSVTSGAITEAPIPPSRPTIDPLEDPYDEDPPEVSVDGSPDPTDPDIPIEPWETKPDGVSGDDPYEEENAINTVDEEILGPDINNEEESGDTEEEKSWIEKILGSIGLNHGGLMASDSSCGCGMPDCMCGGMSEIMGITVGIDTETGNDIPAGSNAENVKDNIPAALSTGEFVVPADVVRWHGLDRLQGMVDEAKLGLMAMHSEGMIHDIAEEERSDSEKSEADKVSDEDSSPKKGKESSVQEERKTPEGNIIEIAEVIVDEDDDDNSKKKKRKDSFAYNNTAKVVS